MVSLALGMCGLSVATVDAEVTTVFVDQDSWLKEAAPGDNFGSEKELPVKNKAGDSERAVYRFSLTGIPVNTKVNSAIATFRVTTPDSQPINVFRIIDGWTEGSVNWGNTGNDFDSSTVHGTFTPSQDDAFVSVNLTGLVQDWVCGTSPNHGIMFIATSNDEQSKYHSKEEDIVSFQPTMQVEFGVGASPCPGGNTETVRDEFTTSSFGNNNGTVNWATNWLEVDGAGVGPTGGNVQITGGELSLDDNPNTGGEPSLEREANVSVATAATFSFDFRTTSGVDTSDSVVVEVSNNGGASWSTLENFTGSAGVTSGTRNFDITSFIAANTRVRFRVNNLYGGSNETFFVDNVEVAFTVTAGGNNPPIAVNDSYSTPQNLTLVVPAATGVLANDNDPDGDPLSVNPTPINGPSSGTLTLATDGGFTYAPNGGFAGIDSFVYEVSDGQGGTAQATVTLTVTPVGGNSDPIAVNDSYNTPQDTTLTVPAATGVLANDSDPDGDPLSVNPTPVSGPSNGTLTLATDGGLTYVPNSGVTGPDSFVYEVTDGQGGSAQATVTLTITPIGGAGEVGFWAFDEGSGTTALDSSGLSNTGSFVGTPTYVAGVSGTALSFPGDGSRVLVPDAASLDVTSGITITAFVQPTQVATQYLVKKARQNGTPGVDDGYELSLASSGVVFGRFNQPTSGNTFRVNSTSLYPTNGTRIHTALTYDGQDITLYINGNLESTVSAPGLVIASNDLALAIGAQDDAAAPFSGILDQVHVFDGALSGPELQALIDSETGGGGNNNPVAVNDSYNTPQDTTLTVPAATGVLANDSDPDGDPLSVNPTPVSGPSNGTLTLATDGGLTYVPNSGVTGPDSFVYEVTDGQGGSAQATVTLTITPIGGAGEVGFWAFDEGSGTTALDSSGLSNTGSFVGTPTYVAGVSGTALSFPGDGSRVLVPDAASLDVTSGITITAFVQPTQVATQYLVKKARQNGTPGVDDGYELSLASSGVVFGRFNQPTSGNTFRVNSTSLYPTNGTRIHTALTYDGQDITLYINGNLESTVSAPGLVIASNDLALAIGAQDDAAAPFSGILDQVHVFDGALSGPELQALIDSETGGGGNNNPVAVNDSYNTPQDTTLTVPAATGVLANDSDPDGDPLSVNPTPVSGPSNGTLTLATDGGLTYVPNSGVTGPDSFVYEVTDGQGGSAQATVTLTITPIGGAGEVGFWAFDEGSGTTALDSSGLGNTGSFVGTPTYVAGVSGTALSFPGDGSRVLVPDAASLDVTSGITITAFVQPTQVATQYLVKKARQNGTPGVDDGYELSLASSGVVFGRFNQPTSGNTFRVNSTSLYPTNGTRIHTALTYDGQDITLYINGNLESTVSAPGLVIASNDLALAIGAQDDAAAPFSGILDQVHVFDGALSGPELQALIDSETGGGGNNNPVAVNDSYSTPQDTTLTVPAATGVLANDSDPDGDPLSVNPTPVSGPSNGTLTLATDGGLTYVPNSGVTGPDSFVYEVTDGQGGTAQGSVSLTVTPVGGGVTALVSSSDTSTIQNPDGQYGKPNQSRLWFNSTANRWDALMPQNDGGTSASDHYIMLDVSGTQVFTTVELEDRNTARPDVFWDDAAQTLSVLGSHGTTTEFWQVLYDTPSDSYSINPAVNAVVVPGISQLNGNFPATLTVSPNGRVWVAVMKDNALDVQHSTDGGATWLAAPVNLDTTAGLGVTTWVQFVTGGVTQVGLFAGENGEALANTTFFYYFIAQNADPTIVANWTNDSANIPASVGSEQADDHVSGARDANENQYFAVKTERGSTTDPLINLYRRTAAGVWSQFTVSQAQDSPEQTRPSLVIDDSNATLSVYTSDTGSGNGLGSRKTVSLSALGGLAGAPLVPVFTIPGTVFNDLITPRQQVTGSSGVVVLGHNRTDQTVWFQAEALTP